jgi:hypothetical protein
MFSNCLSLHYLCVIIFYCVTHRIADICLNESFLEYIWESLRTKAYSGEDCADEVKADEVHFTKALQRNVYVVRDSRKIVVSR